MSSDSRKSSKSKSGAKRSQLGPSVVGLIAGAIGVAATRSAPAGAMPNFAQAYGVDCSRCHTAVPLLNAYGRYDR